MTAAASPARAPTRRILWLDWFATLAVLVLVSVFVVHDHTLERLDLALYDAGIAAAGRPAAPDLVIVAIDDNSLAALGRWPWPRVLHATLLDRLAGERPRAILLDLILSEPERGPAGNDALLAAALARAGNVVLPVIHGEIAGRDGVAIEPIAEFGAAARLGHIQLDLDHDGLVRALSLHRGPEGAVVPHVALSLLQMVDPPRSVHYARKASDLPPAGGAGRWINEQTFRIPFSGSPGHYTSVSYLQVLRGDLPPGFLRDRVVLVGVTAPGLGDSFPTPLSSRSRPMPGVEITANVLDAMRTGGGIHRASDGAVLGAALLVAIGLLASYLVSSSRTALLLTLAVIAIAFGAAFAAIRLANLWFPVAAVVLTSILAYPAWSWRRLEAAQRFLEQELVRLDAEPGVFPGAPVSRSPRVDPLERRIELVREANRKVASARQLTMTTLERMPIGVIVIGHEDHVLIANSAARSMLGIDGGDDLALHLPDLARRLGRAEGWPAGLGTGEGHGFEGRTPDGREVWVSSAPYRVVFTDHGTGAPGGESGELVTVADVSELKIAGRQREEMMRFLSHDMRAPQASIVALVEMQRDGQGPLPAELLQRVDQYARRTLTLADNFVQLARADHVDPEAAEVLDLCDVVDEAADEAWALARAKAISIDRVLPAEALVRGDGTLLRRAIYNLLDNAIKVTPAGGRITAAVERVHRSWEISVIDTGPGIPAELLPRLFTDYARHDQPGRAGVGLGLVLVRRVFERLGGRVRCANRAEGGAEFVAELPAIAGADLRALRPGDTEADHSRNEASPSGDRTGSVSPG